MSALLEVRDVTYGYPGNVVLNSVGFSADSGEFVVLMGVNGVGKSTLIDILAGLRASNSGEIFLRGRALHAWTARERSRRVSHLPQATRHDLPFTVEQMVLMGRYVHADRWFDAWPNVLT
jgi:iron complex transport system ATP-binding protein